ncbi:MULTISPECIES: glycosyltransferase family 2 protein [unclassified Paraburkholderia]|uniref:glycosyltransferase family 2 protein n=1 Tax=unclassified Paraburkholderia TaxID=2615204 RepID=UPI001858D23B|nr:MULTISPECIES: glycosyltransferase family 2 protein [unclassified Paraburkholderia]MBB5445180.1 glycosyltransferase involved in cell wall biosynthesis [Paraburkholderia sp. WSM4177]MBB5485728.1 glycosyltransferase involved in cell wall biosynthesis [Paraburkholderia sp. WSM4180]
MNMPDAPIRRTDNNLSLAPGEMTNHQGCFEMNVAKTLTIAIVAPCYNEAEVLPISIPRLLALVRELADKHGCSPDSYVVLVDDGSKDSTWEQIESAAHAYPNTIRGLRLSKNAGHQNALVAGLTYVTGKCDAAISIDADLQDDLAALPKMITEHRAGAEIVLGVKASRADDPFLKTLTATVFYRGMKWMGVELVENHADCRLMSERALENLAKFPEFVLFLRGLQPLLHGRISTVRYDLSPRPAGHSKYGIKKMLGLALNGITSFSTTPLRMITWTGAIVFAVSLLFALTAFIKALSGETLPGWASITVPLYLLGGLIMLSIGVAGEYIGKIYLEVKHRPRFLVDEVAHFGNRVDE